MESMWPKLEGLEQLKSIQTHTFKTLPFMAFEVSEWKANRKAVLERLKQADLGATLAIRSCVGMEDAIEHEPPGFFDSILNVPATEMAVRSAVEKVISSYSRRINPISIPDKIIVQRQLLGATMSGVFRVGYAETEFVDVEYDVTPERTDAVTSGKKSKRASISNRTAMLPLPWNNVRSCVNELRRYFKPPFFVEFAVDDRELPIIFQVRTDRRKKTNASEARRSDGLENAIKAVERFGPLSVMTDWNPAEILGTSPLPLDVSLYDELLMKGAWAEGRASVGWARPDEPGLMAVVGGRPYIKIKQSLQSLLPAGLEPSVARRLIANRMDCLNAAKDLHDKVEFRVMWSAYAFDDDAVASELRADGFAVSDIEGLFSSLKSITRDAIEKAPAFLSTDQSGIVQLDSARTEFARVSRGATPVETSIGIQQALCACVNHGTIPFSRQARLAFSFRYIINHLVESGDLKSTDIGLWLAGLNTVARQFSKDLQRMRGGDMTEEEFFVRYGHLRPNTYDIESPRYDERDLLSADLSEQVDVPHWMPNPCIRLGEILTAVGLEDDQRAFWQAAAGAYRGREEMKFHFTALLSDVMRAISQYGEDVSINRRNLRRFPLSKLLTFMNNSKSWECFSQAIRRRGYGGQNTVAGPRLPDVIWNEGDLDVIMEPPSRPTFVGNEVVTARVHSIGKDSVVRSGDLVGAIVVVETADPGYDWLFGHQFSGLVTAFGGEFSHMGLRCGEFGISAALGCGSAVFNRISTAKEICIDPLRGELFADGQRLIPA